MQFDYCLHWNAQGRYAPKSATIKLHGMGDDDHIINAITNAKKFYEHDLLYHIAMRGPRGGLFVDAGSNIGNHAIYFATFLADLVIAMEPNPTTARVLRNNINVNQLNNVVVHEVGLAAQSGQGQIVMPNGETNFGDAQIQMRSRTADKSETDIPLKTLDEIVLPHVKQTGLPVNFIKIDVEGMELDVLKGAQEVLQVHRPQLTIELMTADEQKIVFEYLRGYGYESVGQFASTPTFHFLDPKRHQLRTLPSRWACSWHMGKLKALRSLIGWK